MARHSQYNRSKRFLLALTLAFCSAAPASSQDTPAVEPELPAPAFEPPPAEGDADLPPLPLEAERKPAEPARPADRAKAAPVPAGAALGGVRVIDMKVLFETHAGFDAGQKALKAEFEAAAQRVTKDRQAITKLDEELKDLRDGTPEYRKLSLEISRRKADWKVEAEKQLSELRDREAKLLWETYNDIQTAIRTYCEANRVTLVLQYRSEPADGKTKKSVEQALARDVVYVQPVRDITPIIKEAINKHVAQVGARAPR